MAIKEPKEPSKEIAPSPKPVKEIKPTEVKSAYEVLSAIDVSSFVEKKNGLSYVSWAWANHKLMEQFPDSEIEIVRYDGNPYLKTEQGYFVETRVTVHCPKLNKLITRTNILPILDYKNKPIANPNTFDINTSIQRCITKAIALHGLGLSVYAGEDLPLESVESKVVETKNTSIQAEQKNKIKTLWLKMGQKAEMLEPSIVKKYGVKLDNLTSEQAQSIIVAWENK